MIPEEKRFEPFLFAVAEELVLVFLEAKFTGAERHLRRLQKVKQLENIHLAQAINYLEAYKMEAGLLINFGSMRLDFHRIGIPNKAK